MSITREFSYVLTQCRYCLLSRGKAIFTDVNTFDISTSPSWRVFIFGTYTNCCGSSTWFLIKRRQVLWVSCWWISSCKGWPLHQERHQGSFSIHQNKSVSPSVPSVDTHEGSWIPPCTDNWYCTICGISLDRIDFAQDVFMWWPWSWRKFTVVYHSATSLHIPSFIKIRRRNVDGRTSLIILGHLPRRWPNNGGNVGTADDLYG